MLVLTIGWVLMALLAPPFPSAASVVLTSSPTDVAREPELLEIGQPPKARSGAQLPQDIKVVSYNIRWRGGDDLKKLIKLLREDPEIGSASILGLQEVDRNKKRTGNKNTAAILAAELGMYYAWAAPASPATEKEEETGVTILSAYPLTDVRRIVLPHKGPGGRRRAAVGATVKLGQASVRVYSVHSENRMKEDHKIEQMKAVIDDLASFDKDMRAIVLGDLNTWEPAVIDKTFKLFTEQNFQTPFSKESTFLARALFIPIKLKLDWIWLRHLESTSHGIDRAIKLSDHWPLWVVLRKPETLEHLRQSRNKGKSPLRFLAVSPTADW